MDTTEQRDRMVICLAALTSPVRLDIFRLLVEQEPVGLVSGEIAEYLGQTHNGISFHLKSLQHAGLVTVQREGRHQRYRAVMPVVCALVAYLSENCCGGPDTIDADSAKRRGKLC
ncbi:MAG: ArsR/SmtB family transcription factor [Acidithiobacillus ferrivorans]